MKVRKDALVQGGDYLGLKIGDNGKEEELWGLVGSNAGDASGVGGVVGITQPG